MTCQIDNFIMQEQQTPPPKIPDLKLKIVLVGDKKCGKSSLCSVLCGHPFPQHPDNFLLNDFCFLYRQYRHKQIRLQFYDPLSTPNPKSLPSLQTPIDIILLCFDITSSLEQPAHWYEQIMKWRPEDSTTVYLVGCKGDGKEQARPEEISQWVKLRDRIAGYVRTSAKYNGGVEELIQLILRKCDDRINPESDQELPLPGGDILLPLLKQSVEKSWCPLW